MPNDRKKMMTSRETGTVPKVKYWKNATVLQDTHVSNNLASSLILNQGRSHLKCDARNQQRCSYHDCFEGACIDDLKIFPNYNSLPHTNMAGGMTSLYTCSTPPSIPVRKCDNVTKCPDKRQIEEKLNQIREYLKVTNTLISNIEEDQTVRGAYTGELYQMLSALRDSERKLEDLLVTREINGEPKIDSSMMLNHEQPDNNGPTLDSQEPIFTMFQNNVAQSNDIENKLEISEKKLQALHEHQSLLQHLQEKAENQMKDARKAQERLVAHANSLSYQSISPSLMNGVNQQDLIKHVDKNRCPESPDRRSDVGFQDQLELVQPSNEGREQMLRLLDERDNELGSEQVALQQKLQDLNNKKHHIDQLVSQLHNYNVGEVPNEDGDDMANQIRQIVAMKEQLATLKDMLSMVKSTEADLLRQNSVGSSVIEEQVINMVKSGNMVKSNSIGRADSVSSRSETDRHWGSIGKQSNKSSMCSSKEQSQAELQAKRQELEELMYKDQDRTSAINRDVCNELMMDKGDPSFSLDSAPSSWTLLQDATTPRETCGSRENVYSSDEDDLQNYTQLNNVDTSKTSDYDRRNFGKQIPSRPVLNCNPIIPETPPTPSVTHQWNGVEQKQVELMTNLCQSLLEQQQHMLPSQFSIPNFQWYTNYMQTQQALMLSTISQCCQLLWLQQQDINNLMNTVTMIQQQGKPCQPVKVPQGPIDTVTSASSLPNLTSRMGSSNTQYAVLTREPVCSTPQHSVGRNSAIPVIGQPSQPMWGGVQALNNQVAPGNRANNYWDNFRSYSRQNLLSTSTKRNEGSQNSLPLLERNIGNTLLGQTPMQSRSQPSTLSKMNSAIQEGVPLVEFNNYPQIPHEVQNQVPKPTKRNRGACRNRNEWNKDTPQAENLAQKSKLFDMLRENVYKEVTLLISANENRPHFLIQLFRDLQLISSDPLRRSALHSIQALITHSLGEIGNPINSPLFSPEETELLMKPYAPCAPEQVKSDTSSLRCCSQPTGPVNSIDDHKLNSEVHNILMELLPYLKSHNEDLIHNGFKDVIKIMIFQLLPAKHSTVDNKLQSKLDNLLTESLAKFQGRRVIDVKEDLLKTIADVLLEILQVTTLPKERPISENHTKPVENLPNPMMFLPTNPANVLPFESLQFLNLGSARTIDNGDLAEADQSRREAENEEGAVGGMILPSTDGHDLQTNNCDVCF